MPGRPFIHGPYSGCVDPSLEECTLDLVRRFLEGEGRILALLKDGIRTRVRLVEVGGQRFIAKHHFYRAPIDRLRSRCHTGGAFREWSGASLWRSAGGRGVHPVALVRGFGPPRGDLLLLPYVEGPTLQQVLQGDAEGPADPRMRRRIARAMGRQMAVAFAAGVTNRDHKPTNVVLDDHALKGNAPYLIDLDGVQRRSSGRGLLAMVRSLWRVARRKDFIVQPLEIEAFLAGLLREVGARDRTPLIAALRATKASERPETDGATVPRGEGDT